MWTPEICGFWLVGWLVELVFVVVVLMYFSILSLSSHAPEEDIRSHYRWLWATNLLLKIEFRTYGKTVSALNL